MGCVDGWVRRGGLEASAGVAADHRGDRARLRQRRVGEDDVIETRERRSGRIDDDSDDASNKRPPRSDNSGGGSTTNIEKKKAKIKTTLRKLCAKVPVVLMQRDEDADKAEKEAKALLTELGLPFKK